MSPDELQDSSTPTDELRAAWEDGDTIPELATVLRDQERLSPVQLVELCLIDQSYRWRTPEPVRVEDYLAACPRIAKRLEWVFELAYGELLVRRQAGNPLTTDEIEARFTDLAPRLLEQLEGGLWMDEGADSPTSNTVSPASCAAPTRGRFGPCELGEVVAQGGMGIVYRARHLRLGRDVAVKMIRPERLSRKIDVRRFQNEAMTIARLDHPNIIPILDVGQVDGVHYFAMRLIEGRDLKACRTRYLDDVRAAARLVRDIAGAIYYAHQHGILHRDLKPSNVLVDDLGVPYVVDFGLARQLSQATDLTKSGQLLGTPAYLAPEQLSRRREPLTVAADIYGLGAILYVLITGEPPYVGRSALEILDQIRNTEPRRPRTLNPRVDQDLEQICLKALANRPEDRYASAEDLADDLQRFLDGEEVQARPMSWFQRRWHWVRRHPDLATITSIMLVAACVLLTVLGLQTMRIRWLRHSWEISLESVREKQTEAEANRSEAVRLQHEAAELKSQAATSTAEAERKGRLARGMAYTAMIYRAESAVREGDTAEFSRLMAEQIPGPEQRDVRGFEWFLLDRLYRPRARYFSMATGPLRSVRYSRDGSLLAAANDSGEIQIMEAATGKRLADWSMPVTLRNIAFSPDGTTLAAVGDDGQLRLFRQGEPRPRTWPVATAPVWQVAFVGDGSLVATLDQDGKIRLIDHQQGEVMATFSGSSSRILTIAVEPGGKWLISGDDDGNLKIWDLASRRSVYDFPIPGDRPTVCLSLSLDGTYLAAGDRGDRVHVARLSQPWAHQWVLLGEHYDRVQNVAFSADGHRVACCDKNGSVRVWRVDEQATSDATEATPPEHLWQAHQGRAYDVAFDPLHRRLASVGQENHVAVWELPRDDHIISLGKLGRVCELACSLTFSPDGSTLAAAAMDGVQIWDLRSRTLTARLSHGIEPYDQVAISDDGRYVAGGCRDQPSVEVWRKSPDGYKLVWENAEHACFHLAFSPEGDALVITDWKNDELGVYATDSGDLLERIRAEQSWGSAFSPDARQMVFIELDDIAIWAWPARRPLRRLRGHLSTVNSVAYSPDGRLLASCGRDRRIILWDVATGSLLRTMMGHRIYVVQLAFVGNDRLISLDLEGTIRVWNVELGLQLCCLRHDPTNRCVRLAVSPDERWLAYRLHNGEIHSLALSRDEGESAPSP